MGIIRKNLSLIFEVKYDGTTRAIPRNENYFTCWYNIHYNNDYETAGKNKIVIHTRQLRNKFNPELLTKIAELCQYFYK